MPRWGTLKGGWLVYHAPKNRWQVVRTLNKNTTTAAAYCVVSAKSLPENCPAGTSMASSGAVKYEPQPAITISTVNQEEVKAYLAEVEREAARVVEGCHIVRISGVNRLLSTECTCLRGKCVIM